MENLTHLCDTDWKIGSPFGFKKTDGGRLTNGILLGLQPERQMQHSLFEPGSERVMAIITYDFIEKNGTTLLTGKEELMQPPDQAAYEDAAAGWAAALNLVKQLAEAL